MRYLPFSIMILAKTPFLRAEQLNHHPNEALIFKDLESVWNELKSIYSDDFKNLVYGELPKEEAFLETLKTIQERLKTVSWTIKIETKE